MKIGLEVHIALPTKSKLFCGCSTEQTELPNSHVCPVCMGFPGSKPVLNKKALEVCLSVANALKCKLAESTSFIRKTYFYPDLPKSFQISQLDQAVGTDGRVIIKTSAGSKEIRITRVQLEEDPAKIIRGEDYTLIDFNRAGVPLAEIVTAPDISSEEELSSFINELRSILYYQGVDINKELKADLNISTTGDRVEIKNVTGVKNLLDAMRYEVSRQEELARNGHEIHSETRSYDESKMETVGSREKESAEEYGFIFEPDLTVYDTSWAVLKEPVIASRIAEEYSKKYNYSEGTIYDLIKFDMKALEFIDSAKERYSMQSVVGCIELLKKYDLMSIDEASFEKVLKALDSGISLDESKIKLLISGKNVEERHLNDEIIEDIIRKEIGDAEKFKEEYARNPKIINFIVGKVVKEYGASPGYVAEKIRKMLNL
jgi:aspartyl-tRNA(Asn)/glutamyl-tRNA(Gln) amidotransferase subunit B